MLTIYAVLILIEYLSIKYDIMNMTTEIKKLKEILKENKIVVVSKQNHCIQPYNYRNIL